MDTTNKKFRWLDSVLGHFLCLCVCVWVSVCLCVCLCVLCVSCRHHDTHLLEVADVVAMIEHTKKQGRAAQGLAYLRRMAMHGDAFAHPKRHKGKLVTMTILREAAILTSLDAPE